MKHIYEPVCRFTGGLASLVVLYAGHAWAATEVVPDVSITAETNDNPRLHADGDPTASGPADRLRAELRLTLRSYTPMAELTFEPAVRTDAYADAADDELQSTDWFLRGSGRWRRERARLGLAADVARERLIGTGFLAGGPGGTSDVIDVDGVLLGQNAIRTRATFSPYTEVDFGERSTVRLDLRAMDVSYDDQSPLDSRTDFTDWEAGAAYVRALSTRTDFSTRIFGGQYEAADTRNHTDTTGLELRVDREVSSVWTLSAAIGAERSDYAFLDSTGVYHVGTDDNVVFDLDARKRTQRSTLDVTLRRRSTPDSFGSVVTRNELATAFGRDLSQKVRGTVVVRAIDSDGLGAIASSREYGRVELGLGWAFKELWSLLAGYEFSYWRNATADTSARSNSVIVGFNYRGRSRRGQR